MKIGRRNHEFCKFQVWPDYRGFFRRDPVITEASNRYNAIPYILSFILVVNSKKMVENRVRIVNLKIFQFSSDCDGRRSRR